MYTKLQIGYLCTSLDNIINLYSRSPSEHWTITLPSGALNVSYIELYNLFTIFISGSEVLKKSAKSFTVEKTVAMYVKSNSLPSAIINSYLF